MGCLLRCGLLCGAFGGLFGEDLLHALHVRPFLLLEHVDFLKEFLRLKSIFRLALSHNYRHRCLRLLKKLVEDVEQVALVWCLVLRRCLLVRALPRHRRLLLSRVAR